ncbi:hypothetical protein [Actinoplanes sp. NPDC051851]|uniref:hypothetical protein n=1 Tax=Actinoplanes sp. NPDC051851 TaxID=3154753 RepID=UPI00342FE66C
MADVHHLETVDDRGATAPITLLVSSAGGASAGDTTTILVVRGEAAAEAFSGFDLLACLVALRRRLEERDLLLCCQGARRDVWPSGQLASFSDGRQGYLRGVPRESEGSPPVVDLLDPAPPGLVVTVDEQLRHLADLDRVAVRPPPATSRPGALRSDELRVEAGARVDLHVPDTGASDWWRLVDDLRWPKGLLVDGRPAPTRRTLAEILASSGAAGAELKLFPGRGDSVVMVVRADRIDRITFDLDLRRLPGRDHRRMLAGVVVTLGRSLRKCVLLTRDPVFGYDVERDAFRSGVVNAPVGW